jgi:hypothetical protein
VAAEGAGFRIGEDHRGLCGMLGAGDLCIRLAGTGGCHRIARGCSRTLRVAVGHENAYRALAVGSIVRRFFPSPIVELP